MRGRSSQASVPGVQSLRILRRGLIDRPRHQVVPALSATCLLFCLAFIAEIERPQAADVLIGVVLGAFLVVIGFAATWQLRPLYVRRTGERSRLAALALCAGVVAGAVILAELLAIARIDPNASRGIVASASRPLTHALARAYGAAVIEEVGVRLFGMGVIAWIAVVRYGKSPESAFRIALGFSALVFGLAHLHASLVGIVFVVVNGLGGLLLGWIFWRWGLPYAMLCHFAAGVLIQALGPQLLA